MCKKFSYLKVVSSLFHFQTKLKELTYAAIAFLGREKIGSCCIAQADFELMTVLF